MTNLTSVRFQEIEQEVLFDVEGGALVGAVVGYIGGLCLGICVGFYASYDSGRSGSSAKECANVFLTSVGGFCLMGTCLGAVYGP